MTNEEYSSPIVTSCAFEGNSAMPTESKIGVNGHGGGMWNYLDSSPIVTGCTFQGNSAGEGGGGMLNAEFSSPIVENCLFDGNSAGNGEDGGGIDNSGSCSPYIANCTFTANTAEGSGGGMHSWGSSPTVANSIFVGNTAGIGGGGMADSGGSSPTIDGCSFSGNSAVSGDALYNVEESFPVVRNSVLWSDTATEGDEEVWNDDSATEYPLITSFQNSLVSGCGGSGAWDTDCGTDLGGNIDADPLFADAAGGDYHLSAGSPCIDSANGDLAPELDIEGFSRWDDPDVTNTGVGDPDYADMGAYERQGE